MAKPSCFAAILCLALPPLTAGAQTGSTLNCGSASGVAQAMICSDVGLGASDGRLAQRFDTAITQLEEQGTDAQEALTALRESQEAWTQTRNDCQRAQDPRGCLNRAYAMREAELVASFGLEEPASSATYTCPTSAGAEISISFFDLETPSVRIESGEDMASGASVATPDGAKYALNTGQELWVRKDVARFTAPGRPTVTCEIDNN